ncbi:hypothetical protein TNCV_2961041 [Trichonephila clavipes]|nr:hypothetical protein TNCV_2961041 [Trichonephila clavipes]
MLQDYDASFSRVYFSRPLVFFATALFSPPFRPFSPPSLPDPFLYIVSRSTCCQVQAAVPYKLVNQISCMASVRFARKLKFFIGGAAIEKRRLRAERERREERMSGREEKNKMVLT